MGTDAPGTDKLDIPPNAICLDEVNSYKIIHDAERGYVRAHPLPSQAELDKIYREEYYSTEKPAYIERTKADLPWWETVYADRLDTFEEQLAADRRRIIDIGCGSGYFLASAQKRGWQTLGIEPSRHAATHARSLGIPVKECFFSQEIANAIGTFDAAHLYEVLEHIPDPLDLMQQVFQVLRPGGVVCVTVPNDYSPFQEVLRKTLDFKPWWLAPPHHLNYFSFDSLQLLLEKSGFTIFLREATFPIDMFLLMGDNYLGNDAIGRQAHQRRMSFEITLSKNHNQLKRQLFRSFAHQNIGREIVLYGRKTSSEP